MDFRQRQAFGTAVEADLIAALDVSGRAPEIVENARSIVRDAGHREAIEFVAIYLAEEHIPVPEDVRRKFRVFAEELADVELIELADDFDADARQLAAA